MKVEADIKSLIVNPLKFNWKKATSFDLFIHAFEMA